MTDRTRATLSASPFRLDLEQQRKRAKELARGLRAGDAEALRRLGRHHPVAAGSGVDAVLSDAQLVIARELGVASWPRLKAHILAMRQARSGIGERANAVDDASTLHIRCGSDLQSPLAEAGFVGSVLEYTDVLCQGPVTDDPQWLAARARFLARAYGVHMGRDAEAIMADLRHAEDRLDAAATRYERVVLWFEHDSYDQLILARCLARFADGAPRRLELISVDRFPGTARFIGIGQLPPEALRLLWQSREPVSRQQLTAGRAAWDALRQPDPKALAACAASPALPHLARAIRRHCQELPSLRDGLGLTERLILQLLAERPKTAGEVYRELMVEREPLPWLTDLMFLFILDSMKQASSPAFTAALDGDDRHWPQQWLALTPVGRAVLAGGRDWLSLSPPERWLGGVRIAPAQPCWRWDDGATAPKLIPPHPL